jgi:hypothetical protein
MTLIRPSGTFSHKREKVAEGRVRASLPRDRNLLPVRADPLLETLQ